MKKESVKESLLNGGTRLHQGQSYSKGRRANRDHRLAGILALVAVIISNGGRAATMAHGHSHKEDLS